MKKPRKLRLNKYIYAKTLDEFCDTKKYPKAIWIECRDPIKIKQAKRLAKWLDEAIEWMEELK